MRLGNSRLVTSADVTTRRSQRARHLATTHRYMYTQRLRGKRQKNTHDGRLVGYIKGRRRTRIPISPNGQKNYLPPFFAKERIGSGLLVYALLTPKETQS